MHQVYACVAFESNTLRLLDHAVPSTWTWTSKFIKMSNMFDIFNRNVAQ